MDTEEAKMLIDAVHRDYPKLDQMQIETLVWAYLTNNIEIEKTHEDNAEPLLAPECVGAKP